jgi:transcriptional regulator with XRE-family HTH domain
MRDPDPKTTLREIREHFASSHESQRKIAARIGVSQTTIWAWLAGKQHPAAESVARLRAFFDAETKRLAQGDGIRPIERVPFKIVKPVQRVRLPRLCPFCREAPGKIRKLGAILFQGVCPKCGASGPVRESHQEALRAWNGRESGE